MKDLLCSISVNAQEIYEHSVIARFATDEEQRNENLFWVQWYLNQITKDLQNIKTQIKGVM